jgi:hypothetical protein
MRRKAPPGRLITGGRCLTLLPTPEGAVRGGGPRAPRRWRSVSPASFSSTWGRRMAAAAAVGVREWGGGARLGPRTRGRRRESYGRV